MKSTLNALLPLTNLIQLVLLTAWCCLFVGTDNAQAEDIKFSDPDAVLSLSIPSDMIQQPSQTARLLLKHKKNDYPTFNILRQTPEYSDLSESQKQSKLTESYETLTLKRLNFDFPVSISNNIFKADIQYTIGSSEYFSHVQIVSSETQDLIFTWIDQKEGFEKNKPLMMKLFNSVYTETGPEGPDSERRKLPLWLIFAAGVVICSVLIISSVPSVFSAFKKQKMK